MLLGSRMPGPVRGWRFVENDLYGVARRVTELDGAARLIREDGTGQLGLARWVEPSHFHRGGWAFVRALNDTKTDEPLMGEPDARVITWMRVSDSQRIRDMREWHRRAQDAEWRAEARQDAQFSEQNLDMAERFMSIAKADTPARPRAFIDRGLPKAA